MLLEDCIYEGNNTYKTDKFVSMTTKILRYGVIDKDFKDKNNKGTVSRWDFMWIFNESNVEFRDFPDEMLETFRLLFE